MDLRLVVASWPEDATAKAGPPAPPSSAPPPQPLTAPVRMRSHTVDDSGYLTIGRLVIGIGVAHTGHVFHVLLDPDKLTLFTATGTHYRDIPLEPARRYYGSGKPRGGRRQPRLPSTMSSDT